MKAEDLDSAMDVLESYEARDRGRKDAPQNQEKTPIGSVEQFFNKISVAAIKLTGSLKVGDIIEIGDEEEAVRQRVSSMQINRKDVDEAFEGDAVGIKVNHRVVVGSSVYRMRRAYQPDPSGPNI